MNKNEQERYDKLCLDMSLGLFSHFDGSDWNLLFMNLPLSEEAEKLKKEKFPERFNS